MDKRFKYEMPLLVDLREDVSCSGMSCANGTGGVSSCSEGYFYDWCDCRGGSCATSSICGTGTKAEGCCSGTNACSEVNFGSCESGTGVSGPEGANMVCVCHTSGSRAGYECTDGGRAMGIGCGTGFSA